MLRALRFLVVPVALVSLVACTSSDARPVASASASSAPPPASSSIVGPLPACAAVDLQMHLYLPKSAPAGHHPLLFSLLNFGAGPCALDGYPTVAFRDDAGKDLPMRSVGRGGVVTTSRAPEQVVVPTSARVEQPAWFVADLQDCSGPPAGLVSFAAVNVPGDRDVLVSSAPDPKFSGCGPGDVVGTIEVSPFVPDPNGALAGNVPVNR